MLSGPYTVIFVLFLAAAGFAIGPLALAWIWARVYSPNKPGLTKNATYECGLESKGEAWIQFKAEYYLYAIVFLVFDVEAIFLLPFAVAFSGLTLGACLAMLVFLFLLVEGLVWACQKRSDDMGVVLGSASALQLFPRHGSRDIWGEVKAA